MPSSTSVKASMDTARSWLIFFCAFSVVFISMGQLMTFGVYFVELSEYFKTDRKTTSMVGAVCFAMTNFMGPLAGVFQQRYGARACVMAGGVLSVAGMALSYFAQHLHHLYFPFGIVVGAGYGLVVNPAISILPEYFEKYRYFVTTMLTVGGSLGTLVLAPLTLLSIETFTWRGSMLMNAGLCAQLIIFGSIMKSRRVNKAASFGSLFDVSIFKDMRYTLLLLDATVIGGSGFVIFSMITDLSISRGLTHWQSAALVSSASLSTTIARILAAFVSSVKGMDRIALYTYTSLSASVGVLGCVFCYDFWSFVASLFIFGFSFGVKISQLVNVLIDLLGAPRIAIAVGYFMFASGFGGFILPLVAGWIADQTGTENAFIFAFVVILIGFMFCCIVLILRRRKSRREEVAVVAERNVVKDDSADVGGLYLAVE